MAASQLQGEAVQTVPPLKVTDPHHVRRVRVSSKQLRPEEDGGIFKRCLHVVLYYQKMAGGEDSGWTLAGWIKESLERALVKQPLLAGRLWRREEAPERESGEFEVVSNDSGVRLVKGRKGMRLSEFLDLKEETKGAAEAELCSWKVTNFQCGGYPVGISCSLLLADIPIFENFLKRWTAIHNSVLSCEEPHKTPIFFAPNLIKHASLNAADTLGSISTNSSGKTMVFRAQPEGQIPGAKALALLCFQEAKQGTLCGKMNSGVSLFVRETHELVKVETLPEQEIFKPPTKIRLAKESLNGLREINLSGRKQCR